MPRGGRNGGKSASRSSNNKALTQWQCEACTLLNNVRLKQCTLCKSPRPASYRQHRSILASRTSPSNPFASSHPRQQQEAKATPPRASPSLSLSSSSSPPPQPSPRPASAQRNASPPVVLLVDSGDEEQHDANGEHEHDKDSFSKQMKKAKTQSNNTTTTATADTPLAQSTSPRHPAPSRSKRANSHDVGAGLPKTKRGKASTGRASSNSASTSGSGSGSTTASAPAHALAAMLARGARVDWPQTQPEGWPKPLGELTVAAFPSRTLTKHDLVCGCAVTLARPAKSTGAPLKSHPRTTSAATASSSTPLSSPSPSSATPRGRPSRSRQKTDVSIRFRHRGQDLGRLPLDVCRWATPLLECNAICMKGTCIYAPAKLTPREPVILSITLLANHVWFSRPPRTFGARGTARVRRAGRSSRRMGTKTAATNAADGNDSGGLAEEEGRAASDESDDGDEGDYEDDGEDDETKDALRCAWRACLSSVALLEAPLPAAPGVGRSSSCGDGGDGDGGKSGAAGKEGTAQECRLGGGQRTSVQEGGGRPKDQRKEGEARVDVEEEEEEEEEGLRDLEYVCDRMGQVDATLKEVDPRPGAMTCTLRPYQKQALGWMMEREELAHSSAKNQDQLHPMYQQLAFPDNTPLYWSDSMCVLTTAFPPASEQFRGGILADAMGLGKTIQALSLIATLRAAPSFTHRHRRGRRGQQQRGEQRGRAQASSTSSGAETGGEMSMEAYLASLEAKAPRSSGNNTGGRTASSASRTVAATAAHPPTADTGAQAAGTGHAHHMAPHRVRRVRGRLACPATLIVCPMSLVSQWEAECRRHVTGARVLVYYGTARTRDLLNDTARADVIITTYGVVTSEGFRQQRQQQQQQHRRQPTQRVGRTRTSHASPSSSSTSASKNVAGGGGGSGMGAVDGDPTSLTLFSFHFWRIILDEAHMIKNRNTVGARACYRLNSERRWAMTGTPLQNHLQDVFSLLKFLRLEPWCSWSVWREHIQNVFDEDEDKAVQRLQMVLQPILLRRTKSTKDRHGQVILSLPSSNVAVRELVMSPAERDFYEAILSRSKRKFREFEMTGKVFSNYTNILELLLRLRQACDHPLLTLRDASSAGAGDGVVRHAKGRGLAARTFSDIDRLIDAYLKDTEDTQQQQAQKVQRQQQQQRRRRGCEDNSSYASAADAYRREQGHGRDHGCGCGGSKHTGCTSDGAPTSTGEQHEGSSAGAQTHGLCNDDDDNRNNDDNVNVNAPPPPPPPPPAAAAAAADDGADDDDKDQGARCENREIASHKVAYAQHKRVELAALLLRRPAEMSECCICLDTVDTPVVTPCLHVGCSPCFSDVIGKFGECPVCRKLASVSSLMLVESGASDADEGPDGGGHGDDDDDENENDVATGNGRPASNKKESFKYSTKIRALLEDISAMREADASNKCIVFSQWTTMLDLIQRAVEAAGHKTARLDGSLSQAGRARALKTFSSDPACTVFLMTLRSGGVGLNLTAASHVMLVDPWWNPSVEEQAIDRVHRIGQDKQVCVKRFIMLDSVEEKIRVLQARKRQLVQNALATTNTSSTSGDTEQRLADLRLLFGFR